MSSVLCSNVTVIVDLNVVHGSRMLNELIHLYHIIV